MNITEMLETGKFYYRDSECEITLEKPPCGHYSLIMVGLIGITGMHYDSIDMLMKAPFEFSKFTYIKFQENEIIGVHPLDTSEI